MTSRKLCALELVVWLYKEVATVTENRYWIFLEKLRRSGATNMFCAAPYLEKAFNLSQNEATKILGEWMEKYSPDDYKEMKSRGEEFLSRTAR